MWDVASAKAIAPHVKAIGTSSWAVAAAQGYEDGEVTPLATVERLVKPVDPPSTPQALLDVIWLNRRER